MATETKYTMTAERAEDELEYLYKMASNAHREEIAKADAYFKGYTQALNDARKTLIKHEEAKNANA